MGVSHLINFLKLLTGTSPSSVTITPGQIFLDCLSQNRIDWNNIATLWGSDINNNIRTPSFIKDLFGDSNNNIVANTDLSRDSDRYIRRNALSNPFILQNILNDNLSWENFLKLPSDAFQAFDLALIVQDFNNDLIKWNDALEWKNEDWSSLVNEYKILQNNLRFFRRDMRSFSKTLLTLIPTKAHTLLVFMNQYLLQHEP